MSERAGESQNESSVVNLTCKRCGDEQTKELDSDEMIGPHKVVKNGPGLPQRDPYDIVTRREGYGTMPVVACNTCGCKKHSIEKVEDTDQWLT